ncbi:MAG: BON domain-containing protein [Blastocatellia bacterium]
MRTYFARRFARVLFSLSILFAACGKQRVDDAVLMASVKAQMTADGRVSPTRVSVDALKGAVTLKGEVPTQQEKDAAEQVARKVEGVKSVNNQINVNPSATGSGFPTGDEMKEQVKEQVREAANVVAEEVKKETGEAVLLGKIKAKLIAVGFSDIAVEVDQGEATLKGKAASEKVRVAVEVIVEMTEGIKKVNNQLTVAATVRASR